ncbi:MAG: hypothetical protein LIR50_05810 [Bacillota bacterium]|nr:hypothetical protein [Bacillota bacterium]
MKFNLERNENNYNRVKQMAIDDGFTEEELEKHYLDKLSHQTKSSRIMRMIRLAYYLGWLRGIYYCDEGHTKITMR